MDNLRSYSWQEAAWHRLMASYSAGRLPHALLVTGPEGLGKLEFARRLAARLLCQGSTAPQDACGECGNCRLLAGESHPDLLSVTVEAEKTQISVTQVRDLIGHLGMTSYRGGAKVALVYPADAMNVSSANSLLKTLEEPTDNTLLVLVTARPGRLPATILSRCQRVELKIPSRDQALAWLAREHGGEGWEAVLDLAEGAPLRAVALQACGFGLRMDQLREQLAEIAAGRADPAAVAASWAAKDPELCVGWLKMWTGYLIRTRCVGNLDISVPGDRSGALSKLIHDIDLRVLFNHLDDINRSMSLLDTPVNRQGLMEALLLPWAHGLRRIQAIAD